MREISLLLSKLGSSILELVDSLFNKSIVVVNNFVKYVSKTCPERSGIDITRFTR